MQYILFYQPKKKLKISTFGSTFDNCYSIRIEHQYRKPFLIYTNWIQIRNENDAQWTHLCRSQHSRVLSVILMAWCTKKKLPSKNVFARWTLYRTVNRYFGIPVQQPRNTSAFAQVTFYSTLYHTQIIRWDYISYSTKFAKKKFPTYCHFFVCQFFESPWKNPSEKNHLKLIFASRIDDYVSRFIRFWCKKKNRIHH